MKTYKAVAFFTCLIALSFTSPRGLAATELLGRKVTPDPEALTAASRWLATVDAGNYKTARHMMAEGFAVLGNRSTNDGWSGLEKKTRSARPRGQPKCE